MTILPYFIKIILISYKFIVLYSYDGDISNIAPDPRLLCHREWPVTSGTWKNEPPYWQIPNCPNRIFSDNSTQKCLSGRTVYAIGNSVGRQAAFGILELLGGAEIKRENQRDMCPKHETTWGDSCHNEFSGVKIRYLFMQFMDGFNYSDRGGFPYFIYDKSLTNTSNSVDNSSNWVTGRLPSSLRTSSKPGLSPDEYNSYWVDDNCILHKTRECLRSFFNESTENDILIFTLGMSYAVEDHDLFYQKLEKSESRIGVNTEAWLRASAINFKSHISATFKGQVFHVTLAQLNPNGNVASMTPLMFNTNKVLWDVWGSISSEVKPWYHIDQWAINKDRYHLYNDHVHFNGKLTQAMLHQVLNELCPGQGEPSDWPRVELKNQIVTSNNRTFFFIDHEGYRRKFEKQSDVSKELVLFEKFPIIQLSKQELLEISEGGPIPEIKEHLLLKESSDPTVYVINDKGEKCAVSTSQVFFKHGWDFKDVVVFSKFVVDLIPNGPMIAE